ncbi:MAG: SulP family inorganic anion transporter [Chthoniobacteraceae bacterium]
MSSFRFFRPVLLSALKGYRRKTLLTDVIAGMTVGIIAIPLAIGFGIASGATPSQGMWTAIIAGFLISAFGGSMVQVGGPTGAFVPILFAISATYGYDGLALATMMAGVFLFAIGAFRLGGLIKFIPYPVVAGFTSGIAVVIAVGQLKQLLGLDVKLPAEALSQFWGILTHLSQTKWQNLSVGLFSLAVIVRWPKRWNRVPPSIVTILLGAVLVFLWNPGASVATIGSKFGADAMVGLPSLHWPSLSFERFQQLMGPALTIAMLGAIESLLSAMVADGMIETRHDSNQELMGQGIANFICPFFGGISATGAIARTATNIRSGGRTPIAGIVHALTLVVVVLVAAPLAQYLPLASLSAVLLVVAFRMGDWLNFKDMARGPKGDYLVLLVTFAMTVAFDLSIAVGLGLALAFILFVKQMEAITHVRLITEESDVGLGGDSIRDKPVPEGVLVYRIEGPFFFGVAEKLEDALDGAEIQPRILIFRMRAVPAIDGTGLRALEILWHKFKRRNTKLILSGVQAQPMKVLFNAGFVDKVGLENVCPNIDASLERAWEIVGETPKAAVPAAAL